MRCLQRHLPSMNVQPPRSLHHFKKTTCFYYVWRGGVSDMICIFERYCKGRGSYSYLSSPCNSSIRLLIYGAYRFVCLSSSSTITPFSLVTRVSDHTLRTSSKQNRIYRRCKWYITWYINEFRTDLEASDVAILFGRVEGWRRFYAGIWKQDKRKN